MIATFHLATVSDLTYEQYVGLLFNLDRVQGRQAFSVFQGVGYALSHGRIPAAFFESVAASREDAENMAFDANAARAVARLKAGM